MPINAKSLTPPDVRGLLFETFRARLQHCFARADGVPVTIPVEQWFAMFDFFMLGAAAVGNAVQNHDEFVNGMFREINDWTAKCRVDGRIPEPTQADLAAGAEYLAQLKGKPTAPQN